MRVREYERTSLSRLEDRRGWLGSQRGERVPRDGRDDPSWGELREVELAWAAELARREAAQ